MKAQLVSMPDGGRIALYQCSSGNKGNYPILVTHGSLSNKETVEDVTNAYAAFDCWVFEWGGHGAAKVSSSKNNFEHVAMHDVPAAIDAVLERTGASKVHLVTHSGGGLISMMHLGRKPAANHKLASLTTMGSQTVKMATSFHRKMALRIMRAYTLMANSTPTFGAGNEPETSRMLAQWCTWNIEEKWLGVDGFNYLEALRTITIPVLMISGAADNLAPPKGCKVLFAHCGGPKQWMLCGKEEGFSKDFTHGQLVRGSGARNEVIPRIMEWQESL